MPTTNDTFFYPREISGNTTAARAAIGQQLLFTFYERRDVLSDIVGRLKRMISGGGVLGGTVTDLFKQLQINSVQLDRKSSIRLYVPHVLRNTLAVEYEDVSGLAASVALDLINSLSDSAKSGNVNPLLGFAENNIGTALAFAPDLLNTLFSKILGNNATDSIMAGVKKSVGAVGNPNITTLFKNVALRTFNFSYLFSPRDKDEADQAHNIIKYFKESALPGAGNADGRTGDSGTTPTTLTFPREVEVLAFSSPEKANIALDQNFVNQNFAEVTANTSNTNPYLFRTKRCVITDFDLNYSPAGQHNVFAGKGAEKFAGMPTQIEMSVVLKETEIITRNDVINKAAY